MGEVYTWFTTTPQGQFIVGVTVLIFGSKAILSEKNLKGKLWGLGWPGRWWRKRQNNAAQKEVAELKELRETVTRQHRYILWLTTVVRQWEIDAADRGHVFPPPGFLTFIEWLAKYYHREEDTDDDED